ncbi:hypothetical protein FQA39_LY00538 [Lamprigera yunnana]|nr:hypothetical protein FQA39_LY00538 [Lamprigera yunnana]
MNVRPLRILINILICIVIIDNWHLNINDRVNIHSGHSPHYTIGGVTKRDQNFVAVPRLKSRADSGEKYESISAKKRQQKIEKARLNVTGGKSFKTSKLSMEVEQDFKIHVGNTGNYNSSTTFRTELAEEDQGEYTKKEEATLFIVIPPDGGWGWIVVTAAFFSFLIADGIIYTFGIFIVDMSQSLNCSKSKIVLASAIMTGFFCLTGPLISALINRFGFRKIGILGSCTAIVSCLLTSKASSVQAIYLTHGVIGGVGFGMIYLAAVIAVGFYFERLRALATGIAVCGAGLGGIVLPLVLALILEQNGWRYTYQVMAILCSCGIVSAFLLKPLIPSKVYVEINHDQLSTITAETSKNFFVRFHNSTHPTIIDVQSKTPTMLTLFKTASIMPKNQAHGLDNRTYSLSTAGTSTATTFRPLCKLDQNVSSELIMAGVSYCTMSESSVTSIEITKPEYIRQNGVPPDKVIRSRLYTVYEDTKSKEFWSNLFKKRCSIKECCFGISWKKCKQMFTKGNDNTEQPLARPMYRDDIFYSASLSFTPEYQKYISMSKCAVASTANSVELVEENSYVLCSEAIKRTLATMLDFSLLKSPSFVLLVINSAFISMGYYTPYLFIRDRCVQHGTANNVSFWLISCISVTNTIGRIICGIVTSFYGISAISITYAGLFVGGLTTALSGLWLNTWAQFSYAAIYGFSIACTSALRTVIIVDLLGLEKLTNAIGILLMFQGVAAVFGTTLSGVLRDITGNYQLSFHFAGGCLLASSLVLIPVKRVANWEKLRKVVLFIDNLIINAFSCVVNHPRTIITSTRPGKGK